MQLDLSLNSPNNPEEMRAFLAAFEQLHNIKIDLEIFSWADAWTELMKISLYGRGAVISEVGTSWMGSLAANNSLRFFSNKEALAGGGEKAFLPEAWQTCIDVDRETVLAVPWSLNTFLLYFRRDLLAKAGVQEASAFNSYEDFIHTLECLLKIGVNMPIVVPTSGNSRSLLISASSFVWNRGGEFISLDGKKVLFSDPRTMAGLKDYFSLHRFMGFPAQNLYDDACNRAFIEGKAAVTLHSADLLYQIRHGEVPDEVVKNTGITQQPGVPFVGGSNLAIWKHIPPMAEGRALELINYMTSPENMLKQFHTAWLIPANLEALTQVEADPDYSVLAQSIKAGRAYRRAPLWGLVEDKLVRALNSIWQKLFAAPQPNLDQILQDTLLPVEERLNLTLSS